MMVSTKNSPLKDFNPDAAVDLWWEDKVRRPTHRKQKSIRNTMVISLAAQQPLTLSKRVRLNHSSSLMTGTGGWIVTRISHDLYLQTYVHK